MKIVKWCEVDKFVLINLHLRRLRDFYIHHTISVLLVAVSFCFGRSCFWRQLAGWCMEIWRAIRGDCAVWHSTLWQQNSNELLALVTLSADTKPSRLYCCNKMNTVEAQPRLWTGSSVAHGEISHFERVVFRICYHLLFSVGSSCAN